MYEKIECTEIFNRWTNIVLFIGLGKVVTNLRKSTSPLFQVKSALETPSPPQEISLIFSFQN